MKIFKKVFCAILALLTMTSLVCCTSNLPTTQTSTPNSIKPTETTLPDASMDIPTTQVEKNEYIFLSYGSESDSPVIKGSFDYANKYGLFTTK